MRLPCSPCPSAALRGQKVLPLPFTVPLRGPPWTKGVADAVLRAPPRPSVDKRCCRCRSPRPSAALRGQKVLPLPFSVPLRGPPWIKRCCRCRSPPPSVALRGQKVLPLPFSVPLRGPPWTKGVAVAVLRAPPRPSVDKRCCRCRSPPPSAAFRGQKVLPLPFSVPLRGQNGVKVFSVPLRGPPWTKGVAVAVLRAPPRPSVDKRCCRCRSPRPSVDKRCCRCRSPCPSAALRGQKVLPMPFSVPLRGPPWTKGVAVAVLRPPPRPSVDKRCCRCRSPRPSAALRGQKVLPLPFSAPLRGPPWTKGVAVAVLPAPPRPSVDKRCCRCRSPCPSAALRGQKKVFFAPLRAPSRTKKVFFLPLRGLFWRPN